MLPGAQPYWMNLGPDGNVWFADYTNNAVGKITTAGTITEYTTGITAGTNPTGKRMSPGS